MYNLHPKVYDNIIEKSAYYIGDFTVCICVCAVYSLRQRCMQVVRAVLSPSEIDRADIPATLKEDILHCAIQPSYTEYDHSHQH